MSAERVTGISIRAAKRLYRRLLPTWFHQSPQVVRLKHGFLSLVGPSVIYDASFFEYAEVFARQSAPTIAASIVRDVSPRNAIDVGCGTGALLEALRAIGCRVHGLEYAQAGLDHCHLRGVEVERFDIEKQHYVSKESFDIAISMEVAEHLPAKAATKFVGLLTDLSGLVVLTAAPPGQGGNYHVNEQPYSYWVDKFNVKGYEVDNDLAHKWQTEWHESGNVAPWYYNNLMAFRKQEDVPH